MTCYIYIPGLNPYGTLYSTTVCNEMRKIKQQDFFIYYRLRRAKANFARTQTNLDEEFKNFNKFYQILTMEYKKFCLIGHSYGAVFAKYFGHKLILHDKVGNKLNIFTITLDGSNLVETCEYIAYDLLKIDRSHKINFKHEYPICNGINLVQKWFSQLKLPNVECTWKEWLENVKIIDKLKLKQKYIDIYYFPSGNNKIRVVKENDSKINIYYGKTYSHSLHSNKIIAVEIFKIIDQLCI